MADITNLYSTPEGYTTPEQRKAMNEYAQYLSQNAQFQPVTKWTQGVSNMVNALMGGWLTGRTGKTEPASMQYALGTSTPQAPQWPSPGQQTTPQTPWPGATPQGLYPPVAPTG